MITKKLLLAATAAVGILLPATVPAQSFSIEIGDRPYYAHGARYWNGDYQMVWVGGHWSDHHNRWVHGHYVRGEHRRHDWERHNHDEHNNYHENDRNDNDRH
jgi:hypothetical protein